MQDLVVILLFQDDPGRELACQRRSKCHFFLQMLVAVTECKRLIYSVKLFFPHEVEYFFLSYTSLAEPSISCEDWMYACSGPDPAI